VKRIIIFISAVCLALALTPAIGAFAAEDEVKTPSNVTITVVIPDKDAKPTSESASETAATPTPPAKISSVYPSDVTEIHESGVWQIVKTYELGASENPAEIPREDFERSGWRFTLTDIIRKETANAETRDHKEVITINTDTKELEKIMPLLSQTMEYKTEDGFVGLLTLDVASIKVETAGTKTSSYTLSVTREYPHLSTNDSELVPKTVMDKGKTYNLAGVEWKVGNYSTVDYERIPDYYTAIATYTATGSSTKVTGYITTAEYTGTLAKMAQGKTVYTAYFEGAEIRTPLEMVNQAEPTTAPAEETTTSEAAETPEPTADATEQPTEELTAAPESTDSGKSTNTALYVIIAILALMLGGTFYLLKRKGKTHNEKTHNNSAVADDDYGDGDDSFRG
jgi:hypothetical protein